MWLIFEEPQDFRATAIGPGVEHTFVRLPLEIRMQVTEGGFPIAAVRRTVYPAKAIAAQVSDYTTPIASTTSALSGPKNASTRTILPRRTV